MEKFLIISIVLGLTGCSAAMVNNSKKVLGLKLYQDSNAEHTANIRVENKNNFGVNLYPNGCITSLQPKFQMLPEIESVGSLKDQFEDKNMKYKEKRLDMPSPPKDINFAEFKLPADQFLAMNLFKNRHMGTYSMGCSVAAVYKFSANKNYEILDGSTDMCVLEINEILPNGDRAELPALKYLNDANEWAGCDAQLKDL